MTTRPSASLVVHGEVKRSPINTAPKAPLNGGAESPAQGPEFFISPSRTLPGRQRAGHVRVLRPESQPRLALPASPVLHPDTLSLDFIEDSFRRALTWRVDEVLARAGELPADEPQGLAPAAVLLPLLAGSATQDVRVLLTRRADHLSSHAGQISFPGGRVEPSDRDAVAAALRETHEEIGVEAGYVHTLGVQPRYRTTSHFLVTPVVGALRPGYALKPDASEVADVFDVPLAVLMDPRRHQLHEAVLPDGTRRAYYAIPWEGHFIWGVTAALLRNFYQYLVAAQASER